MQQVWQALPLRSFSCEFSRHRAWAMAIKYWIRLKSGTDNFLSNEAYKMSPAKNHQRLQDIHYLLNIHDFSDIWNNPSTTDDTFQKAFKLRADGQFLSKYDRTIAVIQQISYIDRHFSQSRPWLLYQCYTEPPNTKHFPWVTNWISYQHLLAVKQIMSTCPLCIREPETDKHFILKFSRLADERERFIDSIILLTPSFRMKDDVYQLEHILGHCQP